MQKDYEEKHERRSDTLFWEEFLTKLQLVSNNVEFCNAYAYFHLETCPPELQFNVLDSLERITQVQTQLLFYSKRELQSLYPPPQAFYNISMLFQDEKNCECVKEPLEKLCKLDKILPVNKNQFYSESIGSCFHQRHEPFNEKDKEDVRDKLLQCDMKYITTFKTEKTLSWSVPVNSKSLFKDYERVRIDKIQVYLHGAKTDNGVITIAIENAGVSQDRFKGRVFKFYGEPWLREFSYYDENSVKRIDSNSAKKSSIIVSTEVHKQFDGVFRIPTGFSTWSIEVSDDKNPGLDLSGLTKIEIIYSGSFIIGSTDYTTYSVEGVPHDSTSKADTADTDNDNEVANDGVGDDEVGNDRVGDDEVGDDEVGDDEVGDDEVGKRKIKSKKLRRQRKKNNKKVLIQNKKKT